MLHSKLQTLLGVQDFSLYFLTHYREESQTVDHLLFFCPCVHATHILELDHRVLQPAILRSLRLRGDNRFLRPPDLLAPERWLQATVGDFSDGAPALARS
ncbi:hypothetical protein LAZ67_4003386 [Cordylochernes scorpioides]|uniref:Uncharacterized protein n=1 Tax=Cordylochernes scorpioides TaxID=51811 RepID=A0ABY6KEC9_9ARAC|nr:hypothetical protein LAZ67_4003386 [Cordylochernes scorpioides]